MEPNVITTTLFSVVKMIDGKYQFNASVYDEIENINKILLHTSQNDVILNPPLIKLYMILIPGEVEKDGDIDNMNFSKLYKFTNKGRLRLTSLNSHTMSKTNTRKMYSRFENITTGIHQTMGKYFYSKIDPSLRNRFRYIPYKVDSIEEYYFMTDLHAKGSFLDIVKARSVIMHQGINVLNMDTNTLVIDWNELYKNTFGQGFERDVFGLSRCSLTYIAFHNKFIYLCKNSSFLPRLKYELDDFLISHNQDLDVKSGSFNAVYDLVWAKSAYLCGHSHRLTVQDRNDPSKNFSMYPAAAADDIYGLNSYYITVQRQSWRKDKDGLPKKVLPKLNVTVNINGYDIEVDEWFIESYRFLYTDIPKLEEKQCLSKDLRYDNIDLTDYVYLLNKQPNMAYLDIMNKLGISDTSQCTIDTRLQIVNINEQAKENQCRALSLPNHQSGQLYGGTDEDRLLIEEAYDYYLREDWKTVNVIGKTLRKKTKAKSK